MDDKVYHITAVKCSRSFSGQDKTRPLVQQATNKDDDKVRYQEEEQNSTVTVKSRRPRRHTTGGSQKHKEAIQKAKDMISNDPNIDQKAHENNYSTLNRKELISMLKSRYGDDMEKYKSLRRKQDADVEHRVVESHTTPKPKQSHTILTYKTSSGMNGHVRRSSTSSQESSQNSQESLPYSTSSMPYEVHTTKSTQSTLQRQYGQRNRNGSVQSETSSVPDGHHVMPTVVDQRQHLVTQHNHAQQQQHTQQQQHLMQQQEENNRLKQQMNAQQEQHLRELEHLRHEQQVLMTERQSQTQQLQQPMEQEQDNRDHVLYLQYKDEIKRVNMPSSISSIDTMKALFVNSFPGKLSMIRLDDRGLIYIKDKTADLFYELEDIKDVQPKSHLQLRERSTSFDSLASSHNEMSSYDRRYANSTSYSSATLPMHVRRPPNDNYAESLQDFQIRPRSGSGSSLRSDSVLTKPTWQNNYDQHRQPVSYMNNGILSPRTQKRHGYNNARDASQSHAFDVGKPIAPLTAAPKLKVKKTVEKDKTKPTVEEQLADLTQLLHTALNSDEEDAYPGERTPGKLNQELMENLEALSEDNYSKSPTKSKYYTPTALLAAKKRQIEGPQDEITSFNFDSTTSYVKSVNETTGHHAEDPHKGYMHEGPNEYMKEKSKRNFESGLADSLLHSLRGEDNKSTSDQHTKTTHTAATTIKLAPDGKVTSPPAIPKKPPSVRGAASHEEQRTTTTVTTKVTAFPGQYQMDRRIGIASSAASLRSSILTLRSQIDELRLLQTNQTRNFKNFMSQSLQEFNSLASTVSQNQRSGQNSGNLVRDRRFRVQEDYDAYLKRMQNTADQLTTLEDETERLRRDVIQRKRVLEMGNLNKLNNNLETLGKALAELKSRFSGLHDMLKIVMAGELEIIVTEEKFLKDEPGNLDNLFARCKHLSGTLFTLQRLASVQQLAKSEGQKDQKDANQNRVLIKRASSDDSTEDVKYRVTRTVKFTSGGQTEFL